jgi:hypothetical protein
MTLPVVVLLSLVLLAAASVDAEAAIASGSCVSDARAALDEDWLAAFGPEATVQGPKSIETIEREELASIERCSQCPQPPFGYQHPEWQEFKGLVRPGDCIVFFRTNPQSWSHGYGSEGYVLVREGRIVRFLLTKIQ